MGFDLQTKTGNEISERNLLSVDGLADCEYLHHDHDQHHHHHHYLFSVDGLADSEEENEKEAAALQVHPARDHPEKNRKIKNRKNRILRQCIILCHTILKKVKFTF